MKLAIPKKGIDPLQQTNGTAYFRRDTIGSCSEWKKMNLGLPAKRAQRKQPRVGTATPNRQINSVFSCSKRNKGEGSLVTTNKAILI